MTAKKRTRSQAGKLARNKGRAFEQLVARKLREIWPEAKRGYQARGGTAEAPDIQGTPFYIECKHGAGATAWRGAWRQAFDANPTSDLIPIAICRETGRRDVFVVMPALTAACIDAGIFSNGLVGQEGYHRELPMLVRMGFEEFLANAGAVGWPS